MSDPEERAKVEAAMGDLARSLASFKASAANAGACTVMERICVCVGVREAADLTCTTCAWRRAGAGGGARMTAAYGRTTAKDEARLRTQYFSSMRRFGKCMSDFGAYIERSRPTTAAVELKAGRAAVYNAAFSASGYALSALNIAADQQDCGVAASSRGQRVVNARAFNAASHAFGGAISSFYDAIELIHRRGEGASPALDATEASAFAGALRFAEDASKHAAKAAEMNRLLFRPHLPPTKRRSRAGAVLAKAVRVCACAAAVAATVAVVAVVGAHAEKMAPPRAAPKANTFTGFTPEQIMGYFFLSSLGLMSPRRMK